MTKTTPKIIFIWSFLATGAAAASTLLYAFLARGNPWAPELIQIYSLVGLSSGWINTAVLYFAPHRQWMQRRNFSFLVYGLVVGLVIALYPVLFRSVWRVDTLLFTIGTASPVFFVNQFASLYAQGRQSAAYQRMVLFNLFLLLAALGSLLKVGSFAVLAQLTASAGLVIFIVWCLDTWPEPTILPGGDRNLRGILNPALVTIERSVWDQMILAAYADLNGSLVLFLGAKVITFMGNVLQNFVLGQSIEKQSDGIKFTRLQAIAILGFGSLLSILGIFFHPRASLLTGSLSAWLLGLALGSSFKSLKFRNYEKLLVLWFFDLGIRVVFFFSFHELHSYVLASTAVSLLLLMAILLSRKNQTR